MKDIIHLTLIFVVFIGGLYFYAIYYKSSQIESMTNSDGEVRCPNLLIQKDGHYFLYNSKISKVPGVNPIVFDNLEDYVDFLEWQHSIGIRCPVLYVQSSTNAQGEHVYKVRPSVTDLHGGAPSAPQNSKKTSSAVQPHTSSNSSFRALV